jgi:hypothetical protein
VLAQEENRTGHSPAAIKRNIDISFISRRSAAAGEDKSICVLCAEPATLRVAHARIATQSVVFLRLLYFLAMTASTVKTSTVKAATMETTAKMVSRETVPIEMVQSGVMMIAVPAVGEIATPVRSPDPKIRTGATSIYVTSVTPREEQRNRYEAKRYF